VRLAVAIAAALLAQAAAGAAAGGGDEDDFVVIPQRGRFKLPATKPTPARARAAADADVTLCEACHAVEGWGRVRFNHDPTGFPLRGAHIAVACGGCHAKGFEVPVADSCSGCHRDRHAGEFGVHCEGCHDDRSWRPLFEADAHRRTNFPLVGKHALIPCQECHGNQRDRRFAGAAVACASCHQADFLRTGATSIDHTVAGFSRECQTCHNTWRFSPARLPSHDACFRISSGAHHDIRCLGCHSSLGAATFTGACNTGTFTCSGCHAHACAKSDRQHTQVMGYVCGDPKCYQCHNLGAP
jgi:hypothetical protein